MSEENIYQELVKITGSKNISIDPKVLEEYSEDLSFFPKKKPKYVIWPSNRNQIQKIIKLANSLNFSIIPVSSQSSPRHHADTIPRNNNSVILNLSKLNKIINIDRKNRVVMIEPLVATSSTVKVVELLTAVTWNKAESSLTTSNVPTLSLATFSGEAVTTIAVTSVAVKARPAIWSSSHSCFC